jgi:hypothetical protein
MKGLMFNTTVFGPELPVCMRNITLKNTKSIAKTETNYSTIYILCTICKAERETNFTITILTHFKKINDRLNNDNMLLSKKKKTE